MSLFKGDWRAGFTRLSNSGGGRVFGLFWPLFDFKLWGVIYTVDITPQDLNRKSAQKNRKID
jgi:hypothetical protein